MAAKTIRYRCRGGDVWVTNGIPHAPSSRADEIRITPLTTSRVLAVVSILQPPIDRCLAAGALDISLVEHLFSTKHAQNLHWVARQLGKSARLVPKLREHAIPLGGLFRLAAHDTEDEQLAELTALMDDRSNGACRGRLPPERGPGAPMKARERKTLQRAINRYGASAIRRLLAAST